MDETLNRILNAKRFTQTGKSAPKQGRNAAKTHLSSGQKGEAATRNQPRTKYMQATMSQQELSPEEYQKIVD